MSYYPHVEHILERASVKRAQEAMDRLNVSGRIHALSESARTAQEAADSLGVEVGQIASSLNSHQEALSSSSLVAAIG